VQAYVEDGKDVEEITALGYQRALVQNILDAIDRSEYKRRQAPTACASRAKPSEWVAACRSRAAYFRSER